MVNYQYTGNDVTFTNSKFTHDARCIVACICILISNEFNNANCNWFFILLQSVVAHFSHVSKIDVSNPTRAPEQVGPNVFRRPSGIVAYNSTNYASGKNVSICYTGFTLA